MPRWILDRLQAPGERFNRAEILFREAPRGVLLALIVVLGLGLLLYLERTLREPRLPRFRLALLRSASALLLAAIVLGPSLELMRATRIPTRVAVLVDSSKSMGLIDGDATRMERARAAARRLTEALGARFQVDTYAFSSELRPVGADGLADLVADGTGSDLSGALRALSSADPESTLGAVFLFSDGADTLRLATPEDVSRRRAEWPGAPIFPVLAGDPGRFRDLALVEARFDRFGFVRHEVAIEARLIGRGLGGQKVEVILRQDQSPLETRSLVLEGDDVSVPLSFRVKPDRPGTYLYRLELRPLPGEAVVDNNVLEMAISIGRDQVRVLMICGRPSWDERFLRQLLKKDPNVDLVSFFILRDNEDAPGVPQDELSLIPFPYNELFSTELGNFDVVILQNFARTTFLTNLHLENLREWVVERGGGLLLVGGDLGMRAGGYAGTPIADVLPFRLDVSGPDADETPFKPALTPRGASHFVTNLEPDPEATQELFAALPALDGSNRVGAATPGAVVLLEHPSLRAESAAMPVAAVRQTGRGRTMGFTADTSWYWNFRAVAGGGSNREYLRFWQNAVRWLARDSAAKYLSLTSSREVVAPGEKAELRVRALDNDYRPLVGGRLRVVVRPALDPRAPGDLREGLSDAGGDFVAEYAATGEGIQRAEAELRDARGEVIDRTELLYEVRADRTEIESPGLRADLLDAIAAASGGRRLEDAELARPPVEERDRYRLAERRRLDLWDNGYVLGALLLTLGGEWWLRRRAGYP